jgi:DNA modification methylase
MGVTACTVACRFIRDNTKTRTIVDPFCGRGTTLAVANELGFDAIGVDLGGKRCRFARNARIDASSLAITR